LIVVLENIRYKVASYFAKKAAKQIEAGEIKKGLKNFKLSVWIVPSSKELSDFGERLRQTIEEHSKDLSP